VVVQVLAPYRAGFRARTAVGAGLVHITRWCGRVVVSTTTGHIRRIAQALLPWVRNAVAVRERRRCEGVVGFAVCMAAGDVPGLGGNRDRTKQPLEPSDRRWRLHDHTRCRCPVRCGRAGECVWRRPLAEPRPHATRRSAHRDASSDVTRRRRRPRPRLRRCDTFRPASERGGCGPACWHLRVWVSSLRRRHIPNPASSGNTAPGTHRTAHHHSHSTAGLHRRS
jgi:hypothetical protein